MKVMKVLIILLMVFSSNYLLMAKIDSVDVIGDIQFNWVHMNNGVDKTTTRVLSNGTKLYDDLDEYGYTYFQLCFNMNFMDHFAIAFGFDKKDVLWGSHDNIFNQDHYQNLGEFFGNPSPTTTGDFTGFKIDNFNVKAKDIMWGYGQLVAGRQYFAGSVYEETDDFRAINQDLFIYLTSDGFVWTLDYGFLVNDPKIKSDMFVFMLNSDSSILYGTSGGLLWDRAYGDENSILYGMINRVSFQDNYFKNYILYFYKGGQQVYAGGNNDDGYDHRCILGLSYMNPKAFLPYFKVSAEFGYELGSKAVGTYYDLDNNLNWVQKNFYGIANYNAYIYRLGVNFKKDLWSACLFNVGGSGNDTSNPDKITGFYGLNDQLHSRVIGVDYSGYGAIFNANPYTHNFTTGNPGVESDKRIDDPSLDPYPTGVIGINLSYTFCLPTNDDDKVIPELEYFYYYPLPGTVIVAMNRNDQKFKASTLGSEFDASIRYVYKNKFIMKLIYGIYFPGNAYEGGYDNIIQDEIGKDPVELVKFQTELQF